LRGEPVQKRVAVLMPWRDLKRDAAFALGILSRRPFSVLLQVTNRCNMSCRMCSFWSNPSCPEEELSLDEYRILERGLAQMGRFLVSIEGGEPFLRTDLVDIVEVFAKRHVPVLYTNGWFLDDSQARALFANGLSQAGVSIDHADPAVHDAWRGREGAYQKAWDAVRACRDAAPLGGRQVHVMTVLTDESIESIERLLMLSKNMGVGHCVTLVSTSGTMRGRQGNLPSGKVSPLLMELWNRYPHFRVFREYLEGIDDFVRDGPLPLCQAGRQSFNVGSTGDVSACIERINRPVGNVRREAISKIHARMKLNTGAANCRDCWTLCRAYAQLLGSGGSFSAWRDLVFRIRSA
jgi:MoaA/NifB/PqqE/SkfB family radical SAM enzyme